MIMLYICLHLDSGTSLHPMRSTFYAEQAACEDAVLVVGAGIAGLATAAALHKVHAYPGT